MQAIVPAVLDLALDRTKESALSLAFRHVSLGLCCAQTDIPHLEHHHFNCWVVNVSAVVAACPSLLVRHSPNAKRSAPQLPSKTRFVLFAQIIFSACATPWILPSFLLFINLIILLLIRNPSSSSIKPLESRAPSYPSNPSSTPDSQGSL